MGAKTWMLAYVKDNASRPFWSNPKLDRDASVALATTLFPTEKLEPVGDGSLAFTNPPDDKLVVGCFPGIDIIAAKEFGIDYPSRLEKQFLQPGADRIVYLHAMHSAVDWFAFAIWDHGQLVRSLSLSPDSGIMEDIGEKRTFEIPYWSGQHPAIDGDDEDGDDEDAEPAFPFHPLELGEAALKEFFGYNLEGEIDESQPDVQSIPLLTFKRRSRGLFSRLFGKS
jgi:hypothetical protein